MKKLSPKPASLAMYSEETEERVAKEAALENEREERGLSLGDTRARVKKYDRLVKKSKIKVTVSCKLCSLVLPSLALFRVLETRSCEST